MDFIYPVCDKTFLAGYYFGLRQYGLDDEARNIMKENFELCDPEIDEILENYDVEEFIDY